jgi:hypothetical protein
MGRHQYHFTKQLSFTCSFRIELHKVELRPKMWRLSKFQRDSTEVSGRMCKSMRVDSHHILELSWVTSQSGYLLGGVFRIQLGHPASETNDSLLQNISRPGGQSSGEVPYKILEHRISSKHSNLSSLIATGSAISSTLKLSKNHCNLFLTLENSIVKTAAAHCLGGPIAAWERV